MKQRRFRVIVPVLFLASIGTADVRTAPRPSSPQEIEAITGRFEAFQQLILKRDWASMGQFYSERALSLLQNNPVRRDRDSILARWQAAFANPFALRLLSLDIEILAPGRWARQYGTFEIRPPDSDSIIASGKFLYLWTSEAGQWKIALEMDNFDARNPLKMPSR